MSMQPAQQAIDISVVIPCYNAEPFLRRCLDSVLNQKEVLSEIIVIDDGSSDNSLGILEQYQGRIRYETGPNRGAPTARNRGLQLCNADYILFLDADDYHEGEVLRGLVDALETSDADVAFAPWALAGGRGRPVEKTLPDTTSSRTVLSAGCKVTSWRMVPLPGSGPS